MANPLKILGISGSLRQGSYNTAALKAAVSLVPPGAVLEIADISRLPLYNFDLEANLPPPVIKFKNQVQAANAILFVTPEYNFSVSGVLKNAIDWASRPYTDNVWIDKPVAIMGVSTGLLGTARAQYHLRQILLFSNVHTVNKPEVFIGQAKDKFDAQGHLTDEPTRQKISELLQALVDWTHVVAPS